MTVYMNPGAMEKALDVLLSVLNDRHSSIPREDTRVAAGAVNDALASVGIFRWVPWEGPELIPARGQRIECDVRDSMWGPRTFTKVWDGCCFENDHTLMTPIRWRYAK
jgi:hypothetical protein